MRLKSVRSGGPLKRFDSFTISNLPSSARVVMLIGPNGCGKSSIFDALLLWHYEHGRNSGGWDAEFYLPPGKSRSQVLDVQFHGDLPTDPRLIKSLFHYRSAYRYTSRFQVGQLSAMPGLEDSKNVNRSIDEDRSVEQHYARLWGSIVEIAGDRTRTNDLNRIHGEVIDPLAESFRRLFPDLTLQSIGHPFQGRGTFYFSKGPISGFPYVNLSAGEKAAFDLLLDAHLRSIEFPGSIFLLDEPESHLNARVQAGILDELLTLGPTDGQFVIATHSLSMMRKAVELANTVAGEVAFVNFNDVSDSLNPDLVPAEPTRHLWQSIHQTSLEDLASLISPDVVYFVEGSIDGSTVNGKSQFDSRVLSKIFGNAYPEVEFQSIGNSGQVKRIGEALQASQAIRSEIRQVIDRDGKSSDEIQRLESTGVIVWRQRELENYLLGDEVLGKLCAQFEEDEDRRARALSAILASRDSVVATGTSLDDYKARLNNVFRTAMRQLPSMTQPGSTGHEFAISVLAPLITKDTEVFANMAAELKLAPRASGEAGSQPAGKKGEFTHKD